MHINNGFQLTTPFFAALVIFTLGTPPAKAEFVFLSANRSITAEALGFEPLTSSYDQFGDFDDLVQIDEVVADAGLFVGNVNSISSQTSEMTDNHIRGTGRASAFGSGPEDRVVGTAESVIEVVFEIDEPTDYVLEGLVRMTPVGEELLGALAEVRLTGPNGIVAEAAIDQDGIFSENGIAIIEFKGSDAFSGSLEPGVYTFEATARGVGNASHDRCPDFEFDLTVLQPIGVPEPSTGVLSLIGLLLYLRRIKR